MRRMTTNKQINFIDKASKAIEVNNLEEVIKIPFPYVNLEAEEENLEERVEAEEIDFETHTINGTSGITYCASEDLDEDKGYTVIITDENISFPETISTVSALAKWLSENLPLDEYAYIDESYIPESDIYDYYDFGDNEFEFVNNIVYIIGYAIFSQEDYPILEIGTENSPIPEIYAMEFNGSIGLNNPQSGSFTTARTISMSLQEFRAYPNSGGIINVYDHLRLSSNKYLQAPYLYGQLGSNNTKSNAYVDKFWANEVNTDELQVSSGNFTIYLDEDDGEVLTTGSSMLISADSGIKLWSSDSRIEMEGTGIFMLNLPTSDPQVANALWNDNGVLKISSGS